MRRPQIFWPGLRPFDSSHDARQRSRGVVYPDALCGRGLGPVVWLALLAALLPSSASAHNPVSSWSVVRLESDRMELKLEMAAESAWRFLGEGQSKPDIRNAIQKLEARAPSAFRLAASGQALIAREVRVELDEEDGVVLRLIYPRPPAGLLTFEAAFVRLLPSDHMTTITLIGDDGVAAESILLTLEQPSTQISLPPPPSREGRRKAATSRQNASPILRQQLNFRQTDRAPCAISGPC